MLRREFFVTGASATLVACAQGHSAAARAASPDAAERASTIAALRPPRRARPVVAIIGASAGAETTDLIIPFGVLRQSGVMDVQVVAAVAAPIPLMPALTVMPHMTFEAFDDRWPEGADYVIVPALHEEGDPQVIAWIRGQAKTGALIASICTGAGTLAAAGLLDGRRATTHWHRISALRRAHPTMTWVRDRRYVVDRGVATTTGISASIPFSLALVEATAGAATARLCGAAMGVTNWDAGHDSGAYSLTPPRAWTAVHNGAAMWAHEVFAIPVADGVDEIALALTADAYSETFRSRAFAVAPGASTVSSKRGLVLVPQAGVRPDHVLSAVGAGPPAAALDAALSDIARRYGRASADFAALNMEYPWRG